jgi:hypothetical protein
MPGESERIIGDLAIEVERLRKELAEAQTAIFARDKLMLEQARMILDLWDERK